MLLSLKMEVTAKNKDYDYWKEYEEYKGSGSAQWRYYHQVRIKENDQIKIKAGGLSWNTGIANSNPHVKHLGLAGWARSLSSLVVSGFLF